MLRLSGFELYPRWVPLVFKQTSEEKKFLPWEASKDSPGWE